MSLSKRKSRKIIVDGEEFRWSPSQDSGFMVLVAQHHTNGKKIEVVVSNDPNVVIENGSYSIEVGTSKLLITPKLVESVIRDSIKIGWNPYENGSPVQMTLRDDRLEVLRGL